MIPPPRRRPWCRRRPATASALAKPPRSRAPPRWSRAAPAVRPDVIVYDSAFAEGVPRLPELPTQILAVFAMVRAQLGVRVVLSHTDAWLQLQQGPDRLFDGLGTAFDLVTHCHPAALGLGTPAQQAATWCYLLPGEVVPARTTPA